MAFQCPVPRTWKGEPPPLHAVLFSASACSWAMCFSRSRSGSRLGRCSEAALFVVALAAMSSGDLIVLYDIHATESTKSTANNINICILVLHAILLAFRDRGMIATVSCFGESRSDLVSGLTLDRIVAEQCVNAAV
jgi:hypothetical protein